MCGLQFCCFCFLGQDLHVTRSHKLKFISFASTFAMSYCRAQNPHAFKRSQVCIILFITFLIELPKLHVNCTVIWEVTENSLRNTFQKEYLAFYGECNNRFRKYNYETESHGKKKINENFERLRKRR